MMWSSPSLPGTMGVEDAASQGLARARERLAVVLAVGLARLQ